MKNDISNMRNKTIKIVHTSKRNFKTSDGIIKTFKEEMQAFKSSSSLNSQMSLARWSSILGKIKKIMISTNSKNVESRCCIAYILIHKESF
jgi:hypothetical protein